MRKLFVAVAVAAALAGSSATAADPSQTCDAAFVPPSTTAAGIGFRLDSSPGMASATVCSSGALLPAEGSVRVIASSSNGATIAFDGDPGWHPLPCTDGYLAASADDEGVRFYQNDDGGFTSRARAKTATELANDVMDGCLPTPTM